MKLTSKDARDLLETERKKTKNDSLTTKIKPPFTCA